jgi:hypothetical protein
MATSDQGPKSANTKPKKSPDKARGGSAGNDGGSRGSGSGGSGPEYADDNIRLGAFGPSLFTKAAGIGVVSLVLAAVLGSLENDGFHRFSLSYVTAFSWLLALGLGALFWVTLQNLVNAHWSIVLRRVAEVLAANAPLLAVLALPIVVPIFMGTSSIYSWADAHQVHESHQLHHKAAYLNPIFFLVRFVFYFGSWTLLARFYLKSSLAQDSSQNGTASMNKMRAISGPAMIVWALTMTFCAFDLLMSLDALWFSTMFGIYFLASCVLSINSFLPLAAMWLQKRGVLRKSITTEHYHDLGKMMFAFTVFWAYIGFSQFMLLWYANIPEETAWFKARFIGGWLSGWGLHSAVLLFGHFVIPFFGLLSRHIKRRRSTLAFWAIWQLVMIYLDMYWLVMPNANPQGPPFSLIDLACLVGVLGVFIAGAAMRAKTLNLMPTNDPRLPKSLAFENL